MKGIIVYDVITKSLIFGTRNYDKVTNAALHDEGRILATIGQFTNAGKAIAALDNKAGQVSNAAINAIGNVTVWSLIVICDTSWGVNC